MNMPKKILGPLHYLFVTDWPQHSYSPSNKALSLKARGKFSDHLFLLPSAYMTSVVV